ncbi:MAG: glutamate mutase L, partial [Candidatus Nanopelagicales bacterium]
MRSPYVVCVDTGSTFTKAAAVTVGDSDAGRLLAGCAVPTTVGAGRDVLTGLDAAVAEVVARAGGRPEGVRVCSSAGGGLRLAVVGYERAVTAEAGTRVGLSAGARVVHVATGPLDLRSVQTLKAASPDVVLLVGGTDGGDSDVLRHNGSWLAARGPRVPYVLAGNADVRDEVTEVLSQRGRTVVACANVLPRIGVLDPMPARTAIREVFVRHVIGGKAISRGPRFASLVHGATPDLVLAGVEVLADADPAGGDVLLVDVGGATTDIYSALRPDADPAPREVVEVLWRGRTVEGDLGMRWGAVGVVEAAVTEKLLDQPGPLLRAATARHADVGFLPATDAERDADAELARLAVTVALRRHARPVRTADGRASGRDLSRVGTVVASGGVFRHASPDRLRHMLDPVLTDHGGGWRLPA